MRGSWKVQIEVTGQKGVAQLEVPLPAVSTSSQPMHAGLGILLAFLGFALAAGLIGIIFAATRDAALNADERPAPAQARRGRIGLAVATAIVLGAFILGNKWWGSEASANDRLNYRIPNMHLRSRRAAFCGCISIILMKLSQRAFARSSRTGSCWTISSRTTAI